MNATNTRAPAIDVVVESGPWDDAAEATVRRALDEAATALGPDYRDHALAVLLSDDAALRALNAQWRGIDRPTNVLSFPAAKMQGDASPKSLGDIAIAYETAAHEADDEDKPFAHHLSHLAVHGFLHLIGYDHEKDSDAEKMERLERVILARLGIPDPYAARPHEAVRA